MARNINRREVLKTAANLSVLTYASSIPVKAAEHSYSAMESKTFVLVHGAWHGGWCWRDVRKILISYGHRVFTPTLTGLGEREHLLNRNINLTTHKQDVANLIEFEELQNVILVGHSYAGYVVSLVADQLQDRIQQIVYLDASLPTEGKSFFPEERKEALVKQYGEAFTLPPGGLDFLGIPENHDKASWVLEHLRPHPLGTFLEKLSYQNSGTDGIRKTFIRCKGSPRYGEGDYVLKIVEDNPAEWSYKILDTGHDAMVTAPQELSSMLMEIVS